MQSTVSDRYTRTPIQRIEQSRIVMPSGCWHSTFTQTKPYALIKIDGKSVAVHRYVFEFYFGAIPEGLWILHHCDNTRCHNPTHLYAGTPQDNVDDMMRRGRYRGGGKPRKGEHIQEQVIQLAHLKQVEIAAQLGISQTYVSHILRAVGKSQPKRTGNTGRRILTQAQVKAILADTRKHREIAEDYPVPLSAINAIKSGRNMESF